MVSTLQEASGQLRHCRLPKGLNTLWTVFMCSLVTILNPLAFQLCKGPLLPSLSITISFAHSFLRPVLKEGFPSENCFLSHDIIISVSFPSSFALLPFPFNSSFTFSLHFLLKCNIYQSHSLSLSFFFFKLFHPFIYFVANHHPNAFLHMLILPARTPVSGLVTFPCL